MYKLYSFIENIFARANSLDFLPAIITYKQSTKQTDTDIVVYLNFCKLYVVHILAEVTNNLDLLERAT